MFTLATTLGRGTAAAVFMLGLTISQPAFSQEAAALKNVTLQLDAGLSGANSGFMVALEKGFYKEAGLDVVITQGKGSGSTAQLIGAKQATFGFSDGFVVANSVSQGADIKMVSAIYRRNPTAIISLADSGMNTPKDLEGRTLALPTGVAAFQQFPAYTRGCNIDASKIRNVNIDQVSEEAALLAGQVDSIAAFAQSSLPALELRGDKELKVFWFAECGVATVGAGIIAHNDTINNTPELIEPFVQAAVRGFLYARQNPQETVDIVMKHQPATDPEIVRREQELSWISWQTDNTKGLPLGEMTEADWKVTIDIVNEVTTGTPVTTDQVYTNAFAPKGEAFLPPQAD
jgi:NitT/TauT family transport system substrate-binding protein